MKAKKLLPFLTFLAVFSITLTVLDNESFQNESENYREEELETGHDGPGKAAKFEVLRTKDPDLGYVPKGKLLEAYERTEQIRASQVVKLNSVMTSNLDWKEIGPTEVGGRTRAIMWDPNDPNDHKVWVGSVSGGLWYSTNITYSSNPHWYKVNDFWDNLAISSIDYDPTDTQIYYASTGEGWYNSDAVSGGGIWKSTNAGTDWDQLSSTRNFDFIQKLKVDPRNGNVYIATRGLGIRRSTDGGSTWSSVLNASTSGSSTNHNSAADIEFGADNTIYVSFGVFNRGEVWKSSTGNRGDWTKINTGSNGFPNNGIRRVELATAPSDANTIYAMVQNSGKKIQGLYKSTDKGNNWSSITVPTNAKGDSIAGGQAWYNLILQVHPQSTDTLYAGGVNLYKSNDGGSSWSRVGKGVVHADQHMVKWRPNHPDETIFGNDGGIYYTDDGGSSYTNKNSNYNVTQFYDIAVAQNDASYFLGGTQDNGTRRITNGNSPPASSEYKAGGDGGMCFINQNNTNVQIASYVMLYHFVSTDNGKNFQRIVSDTIGGRWINPIAYDDDNDILYITRTDDTLLRMKNVSQSSRSLDTLTGLNFNEKPSVLKISPYNSTTLFIAIPGSSDEVYKMTNANSNSYNLTKITSGNLFNGYISDLEIGRSESEIAITKSNYNRISIFYSSDGGSSWEDKEGNLPNMPVRDFLFHKTDKSIAYVATEIGVWSTNNLDEKDPTWVPSNNGLANVRTDAITYRDGDQHIVAATHGRGIFEAYLPVTDNNNIELISSRYTPSEAEGIAKVGSHVYIADKQNGLQVFDVSDTRNPEFVKQIRFPLQVKDITSKDNYVYEINDTRLTIFDVSDPTSIGISSFVDYYSGKLDEVAVYGDYAYLSARGNGMHIVDVSDPSNPKKVSTVNTQGSTRGVVVKDDYAFLADGYNGFVIVDVSDPYNPIVVSRHNTSGTAIDLDVQGEYLYLNDFLGGFKIFNVSNVNTPIKLSTFSYNNTVYNDVVVEGQYAYLGGYAAKVIDIGDPQNPVEAGYYEGPYRATDLLTSGEYIYTALTKGLHIFRNDLVRSGAKWNTTYINGATQPTDLTDVDVVGNYALAANGNTGDFMILDITDPQNINEVSSLYVGGDLVKVKQRGKYAYCISESNGLSIIDISDVNNPAETSSIDVAGYSSVKDIAFYNDFAFVSALNSGVYVLDITDPNNPTQIYQFNGNMDGYSVEVYGNTLHVGDGHDGYHLYDLSNIPNSFPLLGSYEDSGRIQEIRVNGNYAYVAAYRDGFSIFDISDETNPVKVGYYPSDKDVNNLEIDSHFAYLANGDKGLTVLDITNPNNPSLAGYYTTPTEMLDLDVSNRRIYAANGEAGLNIIENDLNPYGEYRKFQKEICVETNGGPMNVDGYSNYAYVADGVSGLAVIDVTNPASANVVGSLQLSGFTKDLAINAAGTYLYTANSLSGMKVIDISNRTAPQKITSYDNTGFVSGIDVQNNVAALADKWKGAEFIDISDPHNPTFLSDWDTGKEIYDVAINGNYVFISDGNITIVDISTSNNPTYVTTVNTPGKSGKISYAQDYLYVADGKEGITLIDVNDPTNPSLVTTKDLGGKIEEIYATGRFTYVTSNDFGLKSVDYIRESNPIEVAYINSDGSANGVYAFGKTVYLANGSKGLCLFDNKYKIPSEYDIDPNNFVFEVQPPQVSIAEPLKIFNNTLEPIEFNLNVTFGNSDTPGDIVGEWLLTTDWGECDGIETNETVINFFSDNTFNTSSGNTGTWTLNSSNKIVIVFDYGIIYNGTVQTDYMSGDMENSDGGTVGCWTADYLSGPSASTIALNKSSFDAAHRPQKSGVQNYTLTPADNWLSVTPSGGVIDANSSIEVEFDVDVSQLELGLYAAEVEFDNSYDNYTMKVELYYDNETAITTSKNFSSDWSLISIPLQINNAEVDTLFPGLPADIYSFNNHYKKPTALENGEGYWIKFDNNQTVTVSGEDIPGDIPVHKGWNIIGPYNQSINVAELSTQPEGILTSNIFEYNDGYNVPETLEPWKGYWVQASDTGKIILSQGALKSKNKVQKYSPKKDWIEIVVSDKDGGSESLYLTKEQINSDNYALPPRPPANIFDVRFADGTYASNITSSGKRIKVSNPTLPYTIQVKGGDVRIKDNLTGEKVNKILRDGEKLTINKEQLGTLNVTAVEIPVDFTLKQNYPNPFNPTTTIKFGLPEETKVDLEIFDILGQRVKTIVSKKYEAGYHEVEFNASNLSSGVYLYRIAADKFSDVKKMILVK